MYFGERYFTGFPYFSEINRGKEKKKRSGCLRNHRKSPLIPSFQNKLPAKHTEHKSYDGINKIKIRMTKFLLNSINQIS